MIFHKNVCFLIGFFIMLSSSGQAQNYVLTGGPGSGKTTLIRELERRGHSVVREVAEDMILLAQAKPQLPKPIAPAFDVGVARWQLAREEAVSRSRPKGPVFMDRTIFDNIAFIKFYKKDASRDFWDLIEGAGEPKERYSRVFLIESLEKLSQNAYRSESLEQSAGLEAELIRVYENLGFELIKIAPGSVDERVNQILGYLTGEALAAGT